VAKGAEANDENPGSAFPTSVDRVGSEKSDLARRVSCGTWRLIPRSSQKKRVSETARFGLAYMDHYRLFVYREDGQLIGPGMVIHAADDADAIAQAEIVRGSYAAELLDVEGLRIVKYLPGNGEVSSEAAE
jgi:hypothetical protein